MIRCSQVNDYDKEELPCKSDRCCLHCYKYQHCKSKCNYLEKLDFVNPSGCGYQIKEQKE